MNIVDSILLATNNVKNAMERNETAKKSSRLVAFILSLLPIPVIQQSGTMLDRYFSNKDMGEEFDKIWRELSLLNPMINEIADMGVALQEIAKTLKDHASFNLKIEHLKELLVSASDEKFQIQTHDYSTQEFIDSVVTTKTAEITAEKFSRNVISGATFNAQNTTLKASGNSSNRITNSNFNGSKGSVTVNEEAQANGTVIFEEAGIGFASESNLDFGHFQMGTSGESFCISVRQPTPVQLLCPACNHKFEMSFYEASVLSFLACPNCGTTNPMPKIK
ncbi:hypothetical protein [Franconibacter helveticus]|uniref:hypothetical protein n=1 Tax=Franconibacter helveticus TaxID=357240 RepID=UPI000DA1FC55|nr:hypothetical protein [Franconibacter helveticus]